MVINMEKNIYKNTNVNNNNEKNSYKNKTNLCSKKNSFKNDLIEINKKINKIFKSNKYVYKLNLVIVINGKKVNKLVIAKTNEYLLTMDNEKIYYSTIDDIYEI